MARTRASRKFQLTLNNPDIHGWSHGFIKNALGTFAGLVYWCMSDEVGEEGTPHTHLFVIFRNPVEFKSMQKVFYGAHIEASKGTNSENRDYIRKEGKWADSDKKETNRPDTFEEFGELPPDRDTSKKEVAQILDMIKEGKSNYEILEEIPNALNRLDKIERARQTYLEERYKNEFRDLEVTYIWGAPGVGKTRSVMEKYGYENVYRITNYTHPFDGYQAQDVILFEEFRSNLPIGDMLTYLDGYPTVLPCRYADKQACFTKIYLISNIALDEQYPNIQVEQPQTWKAFLRRIKNTYCMLPNDKTPDWVSEVETEVTK